MDESRRWKRNDRCKRIDFVTQTPTFSSNSWSGCSSPRAVVDGQAQHGETGIDKFRRFPRSYNYNFNCQARKAKSHSDSLGILVFVQRC
jgi:hypothetical protein